MFKLLLSCRFFFTLFLALNLNLSFGQEVNIFQSSSNIKWLKIENENFEVIFPSEMRDKANYIFNLLNHYQTPVGLDYDLKTKKIPVILRPEMALPNGFVTLAPRRSEWFANSSVTPFIGSLEWYQSLAVHESRHIVQFDYLKRNSVMAGHYLFGDFGTSILINIFMPSWYFEGDAVWAETVLSDGGRGRSPRFSARLKTLLVNDYIPSYDDLLAGDENTPLPNLYVYGYFLVANAYKKYGDKIWKKIGNKTTTRWPFNFYAFYSAFHEVTGDKFEDFYQETMKGLQDEWKLRTNPASNQISSLPQIYTKETQPIVDQDSLYYLNRDLDHHWRLFKESKPIEEFYLSPSLSSIDIKNGNLVYAQVSPHYRYGFKNTLDLKLFNIRNKTTKSLSNNKTYYHPKFSPDGSKILAINFKDSQFWELHLMDLDGEVLDTIPSGPETQFTEAAWIDTKTIAAFTLAKDGMKKLSLIDLETKTITDLTPKTRNNLYSLRYNQENKKLYFEADNEGSINIFQIDLSFSTLERCTDEYTYGQTPFIYFDKIFVSAPNFKGSKIQEKDYRCTEIDKNYLFDLEKFIGNGPADNYTKTSPVVIDNYSKLYLPEVEVKDFNPSSGAMTAHTWTFIGGRGYQLNGTSSNLLGDTSLNGYLGYSSEDEGAFLGILASYNKFYPIFNLGLDHIEKTELLSNNRKLVWTERTLNFGISLPYIQKLNLFTGAHLLTFNYDFVELSNFNVINSTASLDDEHYNSRGVKLSSKIKKDKTNRQIFPSYGYEFEFDYKDLVSTEQNLESYLTRLKLDTYLPSFLNNHGFKFGTSGELRPRNESRYRVQNKYFPILGYNFSRGYSYEFTPKFIKYTLDYALPLGYPKWSIWDYFYFPKAYAKLFVDHTFSEFEYGKRSLNSQGVELYLESLTLRKLPLTYGIRLLNKAQDNSAHAEFFFGVTGTI